MALERTLRAIFHTDTLICYYRHVFHTTANTYESLTMEMNEKLIACLKGYNSDLRLTHTDLWLDSNIVSLTRL